MISQSAKLLSQQLADQWFESGIAMGPVTHGDCQSAITGLTLVTDSSEQTTQIFQAIMAQALALGHSSAWILTEILFEAQVWTASNRVDWLRLRLAESPVDDASLDSYNERLNRFGDDRAGLVSTT